MARRPHYHVYVIELSKAVLDEPRFRKSNPGYVEGKPCVYVGMTGEGLSRPISQDALWIKKVMR
ncbi:MAG TPA: hypothetical protein DDX06_06055 [Curvibacter sp.]|nr:hypothetical protein [Curvibacter sp.]